MEAFCILTQKRKKKEKILKHLKREKKLILIKNFIIFF